MTGSDQVRSLSELTLGAGATLEELIDRESLSEMVQTFYELFRLPVRVFSDTGGLLAEAAPESNVYRYLREFSAGRAIVASVVAEVKSALRFDEQETTVQCPTGAEYRICAIHNDGRRVGRFVLGPFLGSKVSSVSTELVGQIPGLHAEQLVAAAEQLARAKPGTVAQIAAHLRKSLELILFSGHKALLTTSVHLASVRENFREVEQKNQSLQTAFDRLKELDELKNNFLATVSHELRTPLTSIIGYSEMLIEGMAGELNQEQQDFTSTIHEKGRQLLELITALLDISKLQNGRLSIVRSDFDMGVLIRDVAQTVAPMVDKRGLRLSVQLEAGLPLLFGDEGRLRQVLVNLTDNAMKFSPKGGSVEIIAKATQMGRTPEASEGMVLFGGKQPAIQVRVSDRGKGIADSQKDKIFDAFYQIDSGTTREAEGTGLGLSIVQRLVHAHQGQVHVEDNEPTGTVFVVTLPLKHIPPG